MMPSLMDSAAELRRELAADYSDREELAAAISSELRLIRPDTTTRGRQRAAYRAVGMEPPSTDLPAAGGRRAQAKKAGRRARKAGRKVSRAGAGLTRPARTATAGGLIVTTFALVLLYNLLTAASQLSGLFGSLARAVQWLDDPHATIGRNNTP